MPKTPKGVTANVSFVESSSPKTKTQRPTVVKATLSFEGVVTEGCEDAVMAFLGDHLRRSPMRVEDAEGNVISLSYKGGAKFRVEFNDTPQQADAHNTSGWVKFYQLQKWLEEDIASTRSEYFEHLKVEQLKHRVADARETLEKGHAVRVLDEAHVREILVTTPDEFVESWYRGFRP